MITHSIKSALVLPTLCKYSRNLTSLSNLHFYSTQKISSISGSVKTTAKPRSLVGRQAPLTLTSVAVERIRFLLSQRPDADGLRVGVRTRGCNGLSYTLDFCSNSDLKPDDEVVDQNGVKIYIGRRAQLTLLGTEMDYVEGLVASEFVFNNPNVKGTCGCGESFTV